MRKFLVAVVLLVSSNGLVANITRPNYPLAAAANRAHLAGAADKGVERMVGYAENVAQQSVSASDRNYYQQQIALEVDGCNKGGAGTPDSLYDKAFKSAVKTIKLMPQKCWLL